MNFKKVTLPLILSLSFLFGACQQTQTPDNEGAESQIEEGVDDAGNAIEEGVDDAGDAIEDAGDAVEDATD